MSKIYFLLSAGEWGVTVCKTILEKYKVFKEDFDNFEKYCSDNGLGACIPLSAMGGK